MSTSPSDTLKSPQKSLRRVKTNSRLKKQWEKKRCEEMTFFRVQNKSLVQITNVHGGFKANQWRNACSTAGTRFPVVQTLHQHRSVEYHRGNVSVPDFRHKSAVIRKPEKLTAKRQIHGVTIQWPWPHDSMAMAPTIPSSNIFDFFLSRFSDKPIRWFPSGFK